jgi:hypothetical protein
MQSKTVLLIGLICLMAISVFAEPEPADEIHG